jgi:hypothetical protein
MKLRGESNAVQQTFAFSTAIIYKRVYVCRWVVYCYIHGCMYRWACRKLFCHAIAAEQYENWLEFDYLLISPSFSLFNSIQYNIDGEKTNYIASGQRRKLRAFYYINFEQNANNTTELLRGRQQQKQPHTASLHTNCWGKNLLYVYT